MESTSGSWQWQNSGLAKPRGTLAPLPARAVFDSTNADGINTLQQIGAPAHPGASSALGQRHLVPRRQTEI